VIDINEKSGFRPARTIVADQDVLAAVTRAGVSPNSLAGFAFVRAPGVPGAALRTEATAIAEAFAGPYGGAARAAALSGAGWSGTLPGPEQILSTWSDHQDARGACVVEGEFYSEAFGRRPQRGEDSQLARLLLDAVLERGTPALDELNGLFSGFVYSARDGRVWLFVDRTGARFLFYRVRGARVEAATDLYGFGATGPLEVDTLSLNEQLVLGSPCSERTLFREIRLVPPGHAVEIRDGSYRELSYYAFPRRHAKQSLEEGKEMVCAALDRHVRNLRLGSEPCGIALSGGKDSRVVLAALHRGGLRPAARTFRTSADDADLRNALRLGELLGLDAQIVDFQRSWDPSTFDWDSSVLTLGYFAAWGFLVLGAAAALQSRILFTGFTGDALSGSNSGIVPSREASLEGLARRQYQTQETAVAPKLLRQCLRPDLLVPHERLFESFEDSFRRLGSDARDLTAAYFRQRLSHRNRLRVASNFHKLRLHAIPVHPFADRFVMDAYLSLPEKSLLGQPVHCLAAMEGVPTFGDVPTGDNPFSLRRELSMARFLVRGKRLAAELRRLSGAFRRGRTLDVSPSPRHQRLLRTAHETGLFVPGLLDLPAWRNPENRGSAAKLGSTAIHYACATGRRLPAAPAPLFLQDRYARELAG
jgi:hypothetical protein